MTCKDCSKNSLTGRLNKRVTIRRPPTDTDTYGQPLDVGWTDVATVWAAIEPLRGREYFAAMQENADVTTRIRIRWRHGIDRTMIAVDDASGTVFEIGHIIHPEFAKQELQLMCKERQ
ncbi:phage head closure protein [Paenibacillus sp. sptzw28]|uniref:phage head closure protein n=1 Tax=Paenibacillus sp. sptzw28 TaxID=715179 RepID=UPI001C6E7DB8|nr:phage head closure protein [Paenibacillus sp. sptzw28]QYR20804.1 phage head closure protein [Paenibacillus sp. sptzw28]